MIRFNLKCSADHEFDSWFPSGERFEKLRADHLLECPICGDKRIDKALMSPGVSTRGAARAGTDLETVPASVPANALSSPPTGALARDLAALRTRIENETENVGDRFAEEARAIHSGNAPERPIRGNADATSARALMDDGIPVMRLPFDDPKKAN